MKLEGKGIQGTLESYANSSLVHMDVRVCRCAGQRVDVERGRRSAQGCSRAADPERMEF